jgi:metallo-beta-lactamase family protein
MCTGGRILHHLATNLERPNSTILFVGFQAEGTLGRILIDGAKKVRIMGKEFDVRAKIESIDAYSAHADRREILDWLNSFEVFPAKIFLCHGEHLATRALAETIKTEFETKVFIPEAGEACQLS